VKTNERKVIEDKGKRLKAEPNSPVHATHARKRRVLGIYLRGESARLPDLAHIKTGHAVPYKPNSAQSRSAQVFQKISSHYLKIPGERRKFPTEDPQILTVKLRNL
jgi:hypothetical protein